MDIRAIFVGLAFAAMWSSAFTSARVVVAHAPPLTALTLRFLASGVIAIGIALALRQTARLSRGQWRGVVIFGLCQNALYLGLNFVAMQWIGASIASMPSSEIYTAMQTGVLDGVAMGLPALTRAVKLQKRAARVGFDWPSTDEVIDKIVEEAQELREARDAAHREEEFGDLLFVMANLARHMGIDPEAALRAANAKFTRRFEAIEAALGADGRTPHDSDLAEMDSLWDCAKAAEKASR